MPQFLLDSDPNAKIIVAQPRRLAAITLARRVASERGEALGKTVGYRVGQVQFVLSNIEVQDLQILPTFPFLHTRTSYYFLLLSPSMDVNSTTFLNILPTVTLFRLILTHQMYSPT